MTTLLVLLVVTFWLYRLETLAYVYLDSKRPIPASPITTELIPDDLVAHAASFESDWARQQTMDGMYELYGKLGTWPKVRAAIGFETGTI